MQNGSIQLEIGVTTHSSKDDRDQTDSHTPAKMSLPKLARDAGVHIVFSASLSRRWIEGSVQLEIDVETHSTKSRHNATAKSCVTSGDEDTTNVECISSFQLLFQ